MFPMTSGRILYRACQKWSENGGSRLGAALSYYALFSISPMVLIAMYSAGAVFGEDAAKGKVHQQLDSMMGPQCDLARTAATASSWKRSSFPRRSPRFGLASSARSEVATASSYSPRAE